MKLEDLSGYVIDKLYAGLTGGTTGLPLPKNMVMNWLPIGVPFDESAFDFAIAGPYAGPTPLTLDYFRELIDTIQGDGEDALTREEVIKEAKRMYQAHLLGSWEQWSRLVDFIPRVDPQQPSQLSTKSDQGKYNHVSIVYGQAGQTLSQVYQDTLTRCEVAKEELTPEHKKMVERAKALLQEKVEVEDFFSGEKKIEFRDSRVMLAYKDKRTAYENAVTDYAVRLARSNSGTAADLIEWQRSGGIYKRRASNALREWISIGYKRDVENAQATINQILGSRMAEWVDKLKIDLDDIFQNVQGAFGYPFFPATVLPGSFARSSGWSEFKEFELHKKARFSSSTISGRGRAGLNLGLFSIGGGGGGKVTKEEFSFQREELGIEFAYTQVEIARPAFNPNFFLSRGWRPKDSFVEDYGPLHSDGKEKPSGAMVGYPTKALFVRDLKIHNAEFASFMRSKQSSIRGGASFGWGPFSIGGRYAQSNRERETNLDIGESSITVHGMQLVAFMSSLFPYAANPSSSVKEWI